MTDIHARKPGDRVPDASFRIRSNGIWEVWGSAKVFEGRTVVLFALPGAFTPTCSTSHLPGFKAHASALKEAGVDEIYCLSVNDSFVMNAWADSLGVTDEVTMLPDGNANFTRAMGMLVDRSDLGFGFRSWRYSMLVCDGVIAKMFVENYAQVGDPFQVSGAPTMLHYVKSEALAAE